MKIKHGPDPGPFAKHTDYKTFLRPCFVAAAPTVSRLTRDWAVKTV